MKKLVLLGDEAIAQGAIDAGMSGIYAYPGTPSTEITEHVERSKDARNGDVSYSWCANEKTAVEAALGMSYAGKRAMACMKHVGLNVAADPFINSAITGANGGLIIAVADDPSMHSSQNEQDSRFYGEFAMVPIFEPSNQQEAYDMTYLGFELSEKYRVPVLLRLTTRLAHSRAGVAPKPKLNQKKGALPDDMRQYVLLPSIARKRYKTLLETQPALEKESGNSEFNEYFEGEDKSKGIITSGIAYNYLMETYDGEKPSYPILKIGQYPLPKETIKKIVSECEEIIVIEEGYPFIENSLRGLLDGCYNIKGKLDGFLPRDGELTPNIITKAMGLQESTLKEAPDFVANRPPQLCVGCSHIDAYYALNEAMADYSGGRVMSDIGCYTLGALPPFEAINSCVDMGASITMAKGAADAGLAPAVGVIGDSTFSHSGITGLLDCVNSKSPVTILIFDNGTTAMTGGQFSPGTGKIENICEGVGVEKEHIRVINPLKKNHEENVKVMKEELAYEGVSVVIPRRICIVESRKLAKIRRAKKKKNK